MPFPRGATSRLFSVFAIPFCVFIVLLVLRKVHLTLTPFLEFLLFLIFTILSLLFPSSYLSSYSSSTFYSSSSSSSSVSSHSSSTFSSSSTSFSFSSNIHELVLGYLFSKLFSLLNFIFSSSWNLLLWSVGKSRTLAQASPPDVTITQPPAMSTGCSHAIFANADIMGIGVSPYVF